MDYFVILDLYLSSVTDLQTALICSAHARVNTALLFDFRGGVM